MDTVRARRMIWEKELRGGDLEDQEGEDGGGNHRNTKRSSATVTMTMEGRVGQSRRRSSRTVPPKPEERKLPP
ncbi:hypothetical protein GMDG_07287 [Pseudogymnoascus destructans 20631-21]|uniref:Uncharacterized protein n=1 Tax=Pseudogymnoascus destructans (strain ATCC MYA-4855 / 20631-21) TaxID=658429 RepID=L8FXL5_PSED2|nr:hypothetical protein GMDG_07287 [Pseudogymnoascus destructans 20631-21]